MSRYPGAKGHLGLRELMAPRESEREGGFGQSQGYGAHEWLNAGDYLGRAGAEVCPG